MNPDALRDDQRRAVALQSTGAPEPLLRTYSGEDAWDVYLGLHRRNCTVLDTAGQDVTYTLERTVFADHVIEVTGTGPERRGQLRPIPPPSADELARVRDELGEAQAVIWSLIELLRRFPTGVDELLGDELWGRVCAITGEGAEEEGA